MARATTAVGLEAYPYDPKLKIDALSGLERLRCIADRELATHLFVLFRSVERNTALAQTERALRASGSDFSRLRTLAVKALQGELGVNERELAECLLLDERGKRTFREQSLLEFEGALCELRRWCEEDVGSEQSSRRR